MKISSPAARRNRHAIAAVLNRWLPSSGMVLEVASGTGEHAAHFARRFPNLGWQPSDQEVRSRASIEAWREEADLPLLFPPLDLDVASPRWPVKHAAAILCINMVHISPWAATEGLFAGAARLLDHPSPLILYGPFRRDGVPTAASNEAFDVSLKTRDPAWGLRSVEDLRAVSPRFGLDEVVEMPANNLMLLFRKVPVAP